MDLNITTTNKFINTDQQNNQLLFNAIKNKFIAKTDTEAAAFSPPKFNIPMLKVPGCAILENKQTPQTNRIPTQLDEFLIKQLQEKHSKNDLCKNGTGFVLPNLNTSRNDKFELPDFKQQSGSANIRSLTTAINKLKVQDENNSLTSSSSLPMTIDLTTALANKFETHQGTPPTRDLVKPQQNNGEELDDFEIPFIACDRLDVATRKHKIILPASNDYCVTDVSQLFLKNSLAEPSVVGLFLSTGDNKYMEPLPLKYFTPQFRQQKVKHCIKPFEFDTQSPDDVVLLALSKYQRRHYN